MTFGPSGYKEDYKSSALFFNLDGYLEPLYENEAWHSLMLHGNEFLFTVYEKLSTCRTRFEGEDTINSDKVNLFSLQFFRH